MNSAKESETVRKLLMYPPGQGPTPAWNANALWPDPACASLVPTRCHSGDPTSRHIHDTAHYPPSVNIGVASGRTSLRYEKRQCVYIRLFTAASRVYIPTSEARYPKHGSGSRSWACLRSPPPPTSSSLAHGGLSKEGGGSVSDAESNETVSARPVASAESSRVQRKDHWCEE